MSWFLKALKNYVGFSGRARRKEYWFFVLFAIIISFILAVIDGLTGTFNPTSGVGILGAIFSLAILLPSIAVAVRRLHDTDRTGWWILIVLIPFIGFIVLLVFMILDSTPGDNRFGPNPKGESA